MGREADRYEHAAIAGPPGGDTLDGLIAQAVKPGLRDVAPGGLCLVGVDHGHANEWRRAELLS